MFNLMIWKVRYVILLIYISVYSNTESYYSTPDDTRQFFSGLACSGTFSTPGTTSEHPNCLYLRPLDDCHRFLFSILLKCYASFHLHKEAYMVLETMLLLSLFS